MPCQECKNGNWKYGQKGRCQFHSKEHCRSAEKAIHAQKRKPKKDKR